MKKKRILWIAPNLNHYKSRFLNRLAAKDLELTILSGLELSEEGHRQAMEAMNLRIVSVPAKKSTFQYRPIVYRQVFHLIRDFKPDAVQMPIEKKFSILIVYFLILRLRYGFRLVSYNHPLVKSRNRNASGIDEFVTKMFYGLYDRIIFYTEDARNWAVKNNLLPRKKAFFANNTLDTDTIWKHYELTINNDSSKTILFIGRLVPSKRLDSLFEYFLDVQKHLPSCKLKIIGDGPDRSLVEKAATENTGIEWLGAIVDELEISRHMITTNIVFIPGASGLSIVHAFCYGKPYVTLENGNAHGPELAYLEDGYNGLLLQTNHAENIASIVHLLTDESRYSEMCRNAFSTAKKLSIGQWCQQIHFAMD